MSYTYENYDVAVIGRDMQAVKLLWPVRVSV